MSNLPATIFDHLPQFPVLPNIFRNVSSNKCNIYERDWWTLHRFNFTIDYFSVDWESLLKTDELNVNNSTQMYLNKVNMLLNTYAPLKGINKRK